MGGRCPYENDPCLGSVHPSHQAPPHCHAEAIRNRFQKFLDASLPVRDHYQQQKLVHVISAVPAPDEVFAEVSKALDPILSSHKAKPGTPEKKARKAGPAGQVSQGPYPPAFMAIITIAATSASPKDAWCGAMLIAAPPGEAVLCFLSLIEKYTSYCGNHHLGLKGNTAQIPGVPGM